MRTRQPKPQTIGTFLGRRFVLTPDIRIERCGNEVTEIVSWWQNGTLYISSRIDPRMLPTLIDGGVRHLLEEMAVTAA